jgi:hypothetical protein
MEEFPSNSQRVKRQAKAEKPEEKKVEQVTTGSVSRRKKPLGRRFAEVFTGDDTKGVMEYVFMDVLIPAAKDMVADAVSQGVERKLFGEVRSRGRSSIRSGGGSWTPYNRPSSSPLRNEPRGMSRQARATHNFDDLILENRVDADEVLASLDALIREYEVATVRDLYELVGETASFTDEKYGWVDLSGAGSRRSRGGGYVLILPRPELIN